MELKIWDINKEERQVAQLRFVLVCKECKECRPASSGTRRIELHMKGGGGKNVYARVQKRSYNV